ncbi:hypothetical protein WUBG_06753 [Wuchereria bancrofti]|uniref:Uncharacterized protein n=2 Tax=Wuchereria bancrofti TaxID=6293 RepID=J9EIQ7_WUCBA|nr:hypothetical protein WUBG_06753 [Wuchereria bancrofti]VDM10009.1 unnamed protein product [Wuchereria bancrofti]
MARKRKIVVSEDQTMVPRSDNMIVKNVDHMMLREGNDVIKDKDEEMEGIDEAMIVADNEMTSINDDNDVLSSVDENVMVTNDMILAKPSKKSVEEIMAFSDCEMEENDEPMIISSKDSSDVTPMDTAILSVNEDGISVNEVVGLMEGNDKQNECSSKDGLMIVVNSDKVEMDEVVSIDEAMLVDEPLQSMDKIMISENTIMEMEDQIMISKDDALMEMDKIISSDEEVIKVENQVIISNDDVMEVKIDSIGSISAKISPIDEPMTSVDENEQNVCSFND